jgi:hypothetical protein
MLEGMPDVTTKVKQGAGSVKKAIEALRADDSEDAQSFLEKYDSVSESDRQRLKLEDFVAVSGLSARDFIETLTGALMQQCQDVTKMMVAVAQPKVIAATIKAATDQVPIVAFSQLMGKNIVVGKTNGDTKAMELFHKATGFLPTPKGSNTTINLNQLNQTANVGGSDDEGSELQSMDDFLLDMQDVLRPAQLSAPAEIIPSHVPEIEYLDVEV